MLHRNVALLFEWAELPGTKSIDV